MWRANISRPKANQQYIDMLMVWGYSTLLQSDDAIASWEKLKMMIGDWLTDLYSVYYLPSYGKTVKSIPKTITQLFRQ